MVLVYILVCALPFAMIFMVFFAIGVAASSTVRTGKRMYDDIRPYLNDLKSKTDQANQTTRSITERGNGITQTFDEISGRWAFITGQFQEVKKSPVMKVVDLAERFVQKEGD